MDDPSQDTVSALTDPIKGAWKSANDLLNKIPGIGMAKKPQSDHDKAMAEVNKAADDKTVQDANKTYIHNTQTAAQKKSTPAPTPGKIMTKPAARKR